MIITLDKLMLPGVGHGFFTRDGGVSTGPYASLNCGWGSGDDPECIAENRARAAARLGIPAERLVTCSQVHGTRVVRVAEPWTRENQPEADAMVTRSVGLALGILTADCVPVLFADPGTRVVGACHAGWRGALGDIMAATVEAMVELGARRTHIRAGIGPSITQASYQVGPEFPAPFLDQDRANGKFFLPEPSGGRFRFDLPGYVRARLERLEIGAIAVSGGDTAAEPERFFSYRRGSLAGERAYGRLLSAITLR
jgi:purine-nucleoside/S-methyl-5'-thioadenosine phosphorylase / adenosine deaminase